MWYTTNQKTQNFGQVGSEKWVCGGTFVKFSKIVLESFIHNKKLIQCHSMQFKILQKKKFQPLPHCTVAEGFLEINDFSLLVLHKTSEKSLCSFFKYSHKLSLIQGPSSAWPRKPKLNKLDVGHEGRQACSVLISEATQRGAFVLRIAYGCS